jgi:membrane fusion protein (multidrug efflux system)
MAPLTGSARRVVIVAIAIVVVLAGLGYGGYMWWYSERHVWTDDAYVEGTISTISAKVSGHVTEIAVQDNQFVRKGALLLRVDPRDFQVRRDQARAAVATAEANLRAARSELPLTRDGTRAQIDQSQAALEGALVAVRSSESAVEEARARLEARRAATEAMRAEVAGAQSAHRQAARELERMRQLVSNGFVAQRDFDAAESAVENAAAAMDAVRRRLVQTEREIQQVEAEVGAKRLDVDQARQRVAEAKAALARSESGLHQVAVKDAEVSRAEAQLRQAQADLAFAELQLEHTEVRAPLDGIVSKRTAEVGQVVQMGQPLLAIVPLHEAWVVANFKETQVARLRPGMKAEVAIDGFPGKIFAGTVDSLSAGTGSRFSLLPPENATGNWVKVVQRLPVKILLASPEVGNPQPLRAGMSAVVTIRVK